MSVPDGSDREWLLGRLRAVNIHISDLGETPPVSLIDAERLSSPDLLRAVEATILYQVRLAEERAGQ